MTSQTRISVARNTRLSIVTAASCIAFMLAPATLLAQTSPPNDAAMIGQVTGEDVSITGPSQTSATGGAHSLDFAGGSTIVVHSGQARVEFTGGGELQICGPAKFTVLASGEVLTIAVNFGRIHAQFDPSRPVKFYTPLIKATPLAVMSEPRDVTLGLEPSTGAMCVLAEHGAVEVQQQLSGQTLIVPQPSEVSLTPIPLVASPAAAGSCLCNFDESSASNAPSERIIEEKSIPAGAETGAATNPPAASQSIASAQTHTSSAPAVEETAQSDFPPPMLPSVKPRATIPPPTLPPTDSSILKIVAPPLWYDAKPLVPPTGTISVATVLLAKAAVVEPEWIFHGIVSEPDKASKKTKQAGAKQQPSKNRKGFWAWFHRFLFGGPPKST